MPRKSNADLNFEPCGVCGMTIRYKSDVPRHELTHASNKSEFMHACPFEGCPYETLQKSNLKTHIFTHTGEKPYHCPNYGCPFKTGDTGSFTRHRINKHGYIPKENSLKVTATKKPKRKSPYARKTRAASSESSTSASSSSSWSSSTDALLDLFTLSPAAPPTLTLPTTKKGTKVVSEDMFSYTWDKNAQFMQEDSPVLSADEYFNALAAEQTPFHLAPALGAGQQLEIEEDLLQSSEPIPTLNEDFYFGDMAKFFIQYPETSTVSICPTDTVLNQLQDSYVSTEAQGWLSIFEQQPQEFIPAPCLDFDMGMDFNWNNLSDVSPTSSSDGSPLFAEPSFSPYESYDPSFLDFPADVSLSQETIDFVFSDAIFA